MTNQTPSPPIKGKLILSILVMVGFALLCVWFLITGGRADSVFWFYRSDAIMRTVGGLGALLFSGLAVLGVVRLIKPKNS